MTAFLSRYAIGILAVLLVLASGVAGVQTLRLAWLKESTATDAKAASVEAAKRYDEKAIALNAVAAKLATTQKERDDALKATSKTIVQYIRAPGADVKCLDDAGMRIIADLARAKPSAHSGAPVSQVPE